MSTYNLKNYLRNIIFSSRFLSIDNLFYEMSITRLLNWVMLVGESNNVNKGIDIIEGEMSYQGIHNLSNTSPIKRIIILLLSEIATNEFSRQFIKLIHDNNSIEV